MKNPLSFGNKACTALAAVTVIVLATLLLGSGSGEYHTNTTPRAALPSNTSPAEATVQLAPGQLNAIRIELVCTHLFAVEKDAVGSISFVDDLSVQVFPSYQGKLIKTLVELGDQVDKDQPLYTIHSPDLIQAESTLIATAGMFELTTRELTRAQDIHATDAGVSQRELEQASADQQAAEGALKAAKDAVRVFGKTDAEIEQIIATRKIDPTLVVHSPVNGQITAMNAPPGILVQPGTPPAPLSVADVSRKWMLATVPESEAPLFHPGQRVQARVMAYSNRLFEGRISKIYAAMDANTHRATIRSEISDPNNDLRPGMLANFVISVEDPVEATAVPVNAVVRESDGAMTVWVTTDRRHFYQRIVKIALQKDGFYQVLGGLRRGELIVADGAVFLSNMLKAPPTD